MPQQQPGPEEPLSTSADRHFRTAHLIDTIGGRTARGGVVTMLSHGLKFAVSIVATAILARLLTPQDYGLIGMVGVVINFVALFKDLGLSLATVQKADITSEQVSTLFWVNLTFSLATTIVMILVAPAVAWFYGDPRLTVIAVVSALGFIIGGLAVQHEALLKRQMRFLTLSAIAVTAMIVGYIVGITFAWRGAGFWALVFAQLAVLMANAIMVWIACGWRPGLPRRNSGVRSMLTFGGNITGYSTINYFSKNADSLLIGKVWGPQQLGIYSKAVQMVGLPSDQINEPLSSVVIPTLSRLAEFPERYRKAYLRIMEKVLLLVMPAIALIIVSPDWLIAVVLGPQWKAAGPMLVLIGIAGLFQPLVSTGGWLLVTQGRSRHMLYWSLISAPISILSIVAGLPWGAIGVAVSYSLSRVFIASPLLYWFIGRTGPVRTIDFYRLLAPFTLSSVVSICAGLLFRRLYIGSPILGLAVCFVLIVAASLIVLSLLPSGRAALRDIKNSISLLRPVKSNAALGAP